MKLPEGTIGKSYQSTEIEMALDPMTAANEARESGADAAIILQAIGRVLPEAAIVWLRIDEHGAIELRVIPDPRGYLQRGADLSPLEVTTSGRVAILEEK